MYSWSNKCTPGEHLLLSKNIQIIILTNDDKRLNGIYFFHWVSTKMNYCDISRHAILKYSYHYMLIAPTPKSTDKKRND